MVTVRRQTVLVGLLGVASLVAAAILWEVLPTVFFAITVAYILYPLRQWLSAHGTGARLAAAICTASAFITGLVLVLPLFAALYLRRGQLFDSLQQLPETIPVSVGEFSYTIDIASLFVTARDLSGDVAVGLVQAAPALALKVFIFTLVVYALLLRPQQVRRAMFRPVPTAYRDIVSALHERTQSILYAIYVLQAAVSVGTFLIGYVVFLALGYDSAFTLAVVSGILQFIPILGPSVLVVVLAAIEILANDVAGAITILVLGFVVIGFLPDALIRPRLARLTTGMPGSLYFVGFTGGVLSVGLVGLVAGPVVVALLAEAVSLLTAESPTVQQQLD
ncbi:AI-2E family transporter [Salinibaculum rarum]|uniref:AI-2E family transporter n=1 Tax=Salinibaculum rarum TaxID=3058903 RepID=UPI0026605319|nr:AI-2E family transporter [Salinibaculum sp. KK48]